MLIKPLILAAFVAAAAPAQVSPDPAPEMQPQEDWQTLPQAAPPVYTQEEAAMMMEYIDVLERAVLQARHETDQTRRRLSECQRRGCV